MNIWVLTNAIEFYVHKRVSLKKRISLIFEVETCLINFDKIYIKYKKSKVSIL